MVSHQRKCNCIVKQKAARLDPGPVQCGAESNIIHFSRNGTSQSFIIRVPNCNESFVAQTWICQLSNCQQHFRPYSLLYFQIRLVQVRTTSSVSFIIWVLTTFNGRWDSNASKDVPRADHILTQNGWDLTNLTNTSVHLQFLSASFHKISSNVSRDMLKIQTESHFHLIVSKWPISTAKL